MNSVSHYSMQVWEQIKCNITTQWFSDYTSIVQLESSVCVKVTGSGNLTGFVYWFTLHFPNGETIDTGIQGSEVSKRGSLIPH